MNRVGKLYTCTFPFYDIKTSKIDFKKRPILIIGKADDGDYNVLPVSTIKDKSRIDKQNDILIDTSLYPKLKLKENCYVRTNKQTIINRNNISTAISSIKVEYPRLYKDIINTWFEYNKKIKILEEK